MDVLGRACRDGAVRRLPSAVGRRLAAAVARLARWDWAYPASALGGRGGWLIAGRRGRVRLVGAGFRGAAPAFVRPLSPDREHPDRVGMAWRIGGATMWVQPAGRDVLAGLRAALPFLRPGVPGRGASIGLGDRLGAATPGHAAALGASGLFPVFAQQSVREMTRTGRSPQDVIDDAAWGVLVAGWTAGWGADADHLKTVDDVDRCAAAGFTLFTLDGTDVLAGTAGPSRLRALTRHFLRLAVGVRRAARGRRFAIEVSLDELPGETTPADHAAIVTALRRRGIRLHSLAPRFPGAWEKGVDFRGDRRRLARAVRAHADLARRLGGHKLSVHSGSDKFSVYRAVARETRGRFHLKTAGTSYLEALRVAARAAPALFREIVGTSRAAFPRARSSYHVSARPARVPPPRRVPDGGLERLFLDAPDGRQVLHVGFGAVLAARAAGGRRLRDRLLDLLHAHEDLYAALLRRHLGRHVRLLAGR